VTPLGLDPALLIFYFFGGGTVGGASDANAIVPILVMFFWLPPAPGAFKVQWAMNRNQYLGPAFNQPVQK
jgi:hypothetical protein